MTRTVLILSPHFPPATVAGAHRARHMAKHLPIHGWRPLIMRVDPTYYAEDLDPALAELVPVTVKQILTPALSPRLTRPFGIGDLGLRLLPVLKREIRKAIEKEKPDIVFLTGMPFFPLLVSGWVKKQFGLPVVVDLQDPWVSAHGAQAPMFSKRGVMHRLALVAEPAALRPADAVTSVSEVQNEELRARYAWLADRPMAAIPIGGDPEDFKALRMNPPLNRAVTLNANMINLNYVGTFLPRAASLVRTLFRAVKHVEERSPSLVERLKLNFVGTSNQPAHVTRASVAEIAREEGIDHLVFEFPRRAPFLEALGLLTEAHGVMMIGSDEPHYTASKIYPALMCGRPYISIFHSRSSSHEILTRAGGGIALAFATPEQLDALTPKIASAIETLLTNPERLGKADPAAYADVTADAVAGQYARLFNSLIDNDYAG